MLRIDRVGPSDGFFAVGGDSVSAVMVAARISRELSVAFTVTDLFRCATPRAIAADLARRGVTPRATRGVAKTSEAAPRRGEAVPPGVPEYYQDSLAIIGIACRFPGAADHRAFWANLRAGVDSGVRLSPDELRRAGVPEEQRAHPDFVPLRMTIPGKDEFDPDFFQIPAKNAALMDPQFRLLLMQAWNAIEDAGYTPDQLGETGVYMAVSNTLYAAGLLDARSDLFDADNYVAWLMAQEGSVATMISYQLGLRGPSYAVHANCASSLVALHAAWQCLRAGDARCALVGAASVLPVTAEGYVNRKGLNISSDGRCRAYDAAADGTIAGEGAAVLLLKRASDAVADGDHIYAMVRGVGVTNDGADKVGFYAPGVGGHRAAIEKALRLAGVEPASVSYVEGHGTGTKLGDPVEVAALTHAYAVDGARVARCGLGSVKSNIGHLDTAAGLAGCIKVALSLQHRELPPTLHFQKPNPELKLEQSPFHVVDRLRAWNHEAGPRRAGVSSLGIGGTNAHAILEEGIESGGAGSGATPLATEPGDAEPCLIVLSAADPARRRERVEQLAHFLRHEPGAALADIAFTLQTGRRPMPSRFAVVAGSVAALVEKLTAYLGGANRIADCWEGEVGRAGDGALDLLRDDDGAAALVERWVAERKLAKLAQLWVRGGVVNWQSVPSPRPPRRVSLPGYPFARERITPPAWRKPGAGPAWTVPVTGAIRPLHPLLHENVSTPGQQLYRTRLTGAEFFLADHVVRGERLLPAVAYLEMARAAAAHAMGGAARAWALRHVAWVRPLAVDPAGCEIEIAIRAEADETLRFDIKRTGAADEPPQLLCQATAVRAETAAPLAPVPAVQPVAYPEHYDAEACYAAYRELGVDYGPAHRGVVEVFARPDEVLARLSLPASLAEAAESFALHPALLDAAVHASIGFYLHDARARANGAASLLLPFALEEIALLQPLPREAWARLTRRPAANDRRESETLDIDLLDLQGAVCVRLRGFFSHAAAIPEAPPLPAARDVWLVRPDWREAAAESISGGAPRFARWKVLVCGLPAPTAPLRDGANLAEVSVIEAESAMAPAGFTGLACAVLAEIKALLEMKPRENVLLQVVAPRTADGVGAEGISGLLRTAELEQPRLFAQLVAVEPGVKPETLGQALTAGRGTAAAHLRLAPNRQRVLGHVPAALPLQPGRPWRADGVYLITGGGGALAWIFAEEILRGAPGARVILAGRSPLPAKLGSRLAETGGRITYRHADVTDRAAIEALVADIRSRGDALRGVIHAAGVLDDAFILRKTPASFAAVLAPKVAGACHLDAVLGNADLDFFVLCSSVAGVYGSAGQADYAAANAFLDEFAEHRHAQVAAGTRRGRTVSIAWPLWREGGMRAPEAIMRAEAQQTGFAPMETAEGLRAFYEALATGEPRVSVLCGDRRRIESYLARLRERSPAVVGPAEDSEAEPAAGFAAAVLERLRHTIARTLERPAHRIHENEKFERYGLDSILAVQLTNELERDFGSLPKTLFFEYPSLSELRDYFVQNHRAKLLALTGLPRASGSGEPVRAEPPAARGLAVEPMPAVVRAPAAPAPQVQSGDIAIIGMTGRFPGAADLDAFWENLKAGRDSVTEVPADRWDWRDFDPAERGRPELAAGKWGGFLEEIDRFDPQLFNLAPREADLVDPQERLFLEAVWNLLEGAGCTRANLRERYAGQVGVFAASMYQHYHAFRSDPLSEAVVSLSSFSGIANRVSYFFDFQGPSVAVDTMCSSAIVAIQMACDCLRSGEALCAIAGGVNLSLHPKKFLGLTASKLMGTHAGSRSFAEGDGYLPAEGVGAVLLKPLARAIADGDAILGVIKAATTNHSGQSAGFAVPNPKAQAEALLNCLTRAGVDPRTITYVESAANGSPLGDSIEVKALRAAFANDPAGAANRRIGSVKSNIGHAEAASGLAQLAKVVLQLRHRQLVPTIKTQPRNPNLELEGAPFALQEQLEEWRRPVIAIDGTPREVPLRAVIQSVGAGGSSAHLVVEEYRDRASSGMTAAVAAETDTPRLVLLSARTRERLAVMTDNLRQHLSEHPELRLGEVAQTLMFGREPMDHRAALIVRSRAELLQGLADLGAQLRTEGSPQRPAAVPCFVGDLETASPAVRELLGGHDGERVLQQWIASRALEKLGVWWTQGGEVAWSKLEETRAARLVALPTYPFERRRCWIREMDTAMPPVAAAPASERGPDSAADLKSFLRARVGELLGLAPDEVSTAKPLNTLGFTSLDAVNLKSRLEQAFAIEVPLATLHAYQTLSRLEEELRLRLSARLEAVSAAGPLLPVIAPAPAARHQPFPLNDIQESFFAGRKLGRGADRAGCHIYFEIELPELDLYRLNAAWARLVARHEMLRAVFLPDGTQQILAEPPPYRIKAVDLRRLEASERAARLERTREAMSHRVYDPEQWPLFDISVSLLPAARVIHFSIDELIVDAASVDVLFQEWQRLYAQPEAALPGLELSFRDYVLAARQFAASPHYARDLEYWLGKLADMPPGPALPGPREAGLAAAAASRRCLRLDATLSAPEWAALQQRAAALQVSPTALLLGVFAEVLRTRAAEKTFSLILTFFNRPPIHPQIAQLVGPLISTSLFVADEAPGEELPARLQRTQRALWSDLDHNRVSGITVLRELGRRQRRTAAVPLPVVFTSMLGNRQATADTLLRHLRYSVTQTPQVYLDHQLYEEAGELRFSWDVVPGYFAAGVVEGLFAGYVRLLRALAADTGAWAADRWREVAAGAETPASEPVLMPRPGDALAPFPLTDQQQAYAFGRTAAGGGKGANVYLEIEAAQLDATRLEAAWQRMIAGHPMLRTIIRADGRQQVMAETPRYAVRTEDLTGSDEDVRRDRLAAIAREMSARACPLDRWPFFEVRVSRLPGGAARIHLCVDLLIADGASIDRLTQELLELYAAPDAAWEPPAVTFRDYVLHQRALAQSAAHESALRYWQDKFAAVPSGPALPRALDGAETGQIGRLVARQPGWLRLQEKAAELQVARGMILLAAFADVLWTRVAGKPFTLVIPGWERPPVHPEIDRVVGDFTAMSWLIVRERSGTFAERVVADHRAVQADLARGAASGLRVLRKLNARSAAATGSGFPVVFTNLSPVPPLRLPAGMRPGRAVSQTPHVEIDTMTAEHGDELELCWDVAAGVFPPGTVEAMFAEYTQILARLALDAAAWDRRVVLGGDSGAGGLA